MSFTKDNDFVKVPVSVVTGFLGSGKTTLLNYLTAQPKMNDIALIVNEFGEVGLDNLLIESSIENTLLLKNGCICCSIRGDLVDTVTDLFSKVENSQIPKFKKIIIETTGLANPGPIVNSLQNENLINRKCRLSSVITLVDGVHGLTQLVKYEEVKIQISQADLCLVSKCDIGSTEKIAKLERAILEINPAVSIKKISKGQINGDFLFRKASTTSLNIKAFDKHFHGEKNNFSHGEISSWSFVSDKEIDKVKFRNWITMLYTLRPYALLRMKGVLKFQEGGPPFLIQAVGDKVNDFEILDSWPQGLTQTRLVLIFKGLTRSTINASFSRWVLGK